MSDTIEAKGEVIDVMPRTQSAEMLPEKSIEPAPDKKSFSTNGGVGVEARDVNADVTIGVDKVDKSVSVGANSTLTINNDNSKTVNKNRFAEAIGMQTPDAVDKSAESSMSK